MERVWLSLWWWVFDLTHIVVGLVWIGIVVGLLEVERRRRKLNLPAAAADPTCPTCGYVVIGLPSKVCPECGSDLASLGVVRRDDHRTSRAARVTLWTILFALPAFLAWREVQVRLPVLNEHTTVQTFSGPLSGAYKSMEVRVTQRYWQWPRRPRAMPQSSRMEFRLQRLDNSQPVYVMERPNLPPDQRSKYVEQFIAAQSPRDYPRIFDPRPLLAWMRTQGVNPADIAVQAEADSIGVVLDQQTAGVGRPGAFWPFASMPVVYSAYNGRPWWLYAGCAAVALVLWLLGALLFARRRTLPYERTALPQPA